MIRSTRKLLISFLLLSSACTLNSSPEQTSVVVGNNYISDIYTVIEKSDGRLMVGSGDEIITLSPKELPPSFLKSWGIDIQKNLDQFAKTEAQELKNKIAESNRLHEASELIKRTYSDIQLPFIANSNFHDLGIKIKKGSQFTVLPFYKDGNTSFIHFKIVLRDGENNWRENISTSGINFINYRHIDINWETKGSNNTKHVIKGYEEISRSSKRVIGATVGGESVYQTYTTSYRNYYFEAIDSDVEDPSIAYRTHTGIITKALINKHTEKVYCGTDLYEVISRYIRNTRWLVISSDGSLRQYNY